ncbi:GMC oxidoreductase, partial [Apodospora peruviana]
RNVNSVQHSYDYIIAGGGLSGLVVANRLTEDAKTTVLVVEYGDFDDTWNTAMPYYANFLPAPSVALEPLCVPQANLGNREFPVRTGATVGGGSTVNGMAVVRGEVDDYNLWAELGNDGWGWEDLLPYFEKSSMLNAPEPSIQQKYNYTFSQEGFGHGPFQASFPSWQWPDAYTITSAITKDLNLPFRKEGGTAGHNTGIVWKPLGIDGKNMTRCSARKAYYDPASQRPNLDILVTSFVSKVNFNHTDELTTVTGVEIVDRENSSAKVNITAAKEVILAAGAIHTPQILQLSGIGPASLLQSLEVPVIQDLPGVGANLQDRPRNTWKFTFKTPDPISFPLLLSNTSSPTFQSYLSEYMTNRTGPLTTAHGNNLLTVSLSNLTSSPESISSTLYSQNSDDFAPPFYFSTLSDPSDPASSSPLLEGLRVQTFLTNRLIASSVSGLFEISYGSGDSRMGLTNLKSLSRGTVHINSTDPHPGNSPPLVDYNSFSHPFDITLAVLGFKMARKILATPTLTKKLQPVELVPGLAGVQTDKEIEKALRELVLEPSSANQCGTAAMLPQGLGGVVDNELKVYGVNRLRIVDASVLPVGPAGHLQATMYAVAEKAADIIK